MSFYTIHKKDKDAVFTAVKADSGKFYFVTLKIRNTGNTSINPEDFTTRLTVDFGDEAETLAIDVVEAKIVVLK